MSISATLTQPSADQVQTTSVKDVEYSCEYEVPENQDNEEWGKDPDGNLVFNRSKAIYWVSSGVYYDDVTISWSFFPGKDEVSNEISGTHTFSLDTDPGKEVTIEATANLVYSRYVWQTIEVRDDLESMWTYDISSSYNDWDKEFTDSDSASCAVYTRPGVFTKYDFEADKTPVCGEDGLNKDRIQAWCDHCGKFLSWKNQEDCYDDANDCTLNAKYVTASWFNKQAEICGADIRVEVNDIIKASLFKTLGEAISKEDN